MSAKTTEITIDLGEAGLATHQLSLGTKDSKNFSRRALVLGSVDAKSWTSLGDGYLFSLATPASLVVHLHFHTEKLGRVTFAF